MTMIECEAEEGRQARKSKPAIRIASTTPNMFKLSLLLSALVDQARDRIGTQFGSCRPRSPRIGIPSPESADQPLKIDGRKQ